MTTTRSRVPSGTVVVGVDGSKSATQALDWAITQAVLEHRPLTLAHGVSGGASARVDQVGLDREVLLNALRQDADAVLAAGRAHVLSIAPDLEVHEALVFVDPRALLLEMSGDASMVVLGSRGHGSIASLLLGSVGAAVSKHALCPVVVLRPADQVTTVRDGVLVGADGTPRSREVLEFAYRIAAARDLPLTVLHCYWGSSALLAGVPQPLSDAAALEEERLLLAEAVAGMAEKFPEVRVHTRLARGFAADRLVSSSERMDLVVVGAHEGGLLSRVTQGSVASAVVEHAQTAVAVVPVRP